MSNSKAWGRRLALLMGTASIFALANADVRAEEKVSESIAAASDTKDEIPEIVVTAEKREKSLQKAPVAITAISAETLEQSNIKSAVDLNGVVPGLTITPNEGWSRVVAIRGVGYETAQNSIAQPSTAFHVDGVYIVNPVALQQTFLDVNRLEILRGPQGTVYGQNAVGGTINVVTNQPDLYNYTGTASVGYGTYNLLDTTGVFNIPLVKGQLAVRGAFEHLQHDGFAKTRSSALNGYELDDANNTTGRAEILWAPNNDFSATLLSQIYNSNADDAALKNILDPNTDPRELTQDYPGWMKTRQYVEALTLKWNLDWATLKSISSYQNASWHAAFDNDRFDQANYPTGHDIMPYTGQTNISWTQELNLTSPGNEVIDWIVGGFYLHTINKARVVEYYNTYDGQPTPDIEDLPVGGLPVNWGYGVRAVTTRESYSGYGQATYHFTDALRFTAGARFTHDTVDGWSLSSFGAYGPAATASISGNKVTGKIGLEYDLTAQNMLYASWSRGFKPGGTSLNSNPTLIKTTFQPETVDSYEVGSKNRFFDNKATANFAAFYYDYKNFQFMGDDPVPYQGGVANIPKAKVYGAEAEFGAVLPYSLRLDGNATVLHSEITSDYYALDSVAANSAAASSGCDYSGGYYAYIMCLTAARGSAVKNVKGNSLPKTPSFAGSLALTHTYDFADGGELTSRVQYVYQGGFDYRVFNSDVLDSLSSYGLWNLYFDYVPPESPWKLSLTGTNIFDKDAVSSRFTNAWGIGSTANQYIPPRQVIARVSYSF